MTDGKLPIELGSEFAGHRIEEIAGRGGMGVVYRAIDLRLERRVALKVISPDLAEDPEFHRRFETEARLAASLDHPNVIPIHHAGTENGILYVTMRLVEGTDLRDMIAAGGAIEPRLAALITAQVGAALDAAHARGLVHRDIKPANVLITGSGEQTHAYLTDFGLSKVASSQSGMTSTGMIVGTIDYMAPEQVQDGARVDARSDVYALGALLYHALTGEVPFPRPSDAAKIFAHGTDPVPDPCEIHPDLPAAFSEVVARGMAKDPEDRYLSAGDLGRAALAAAEGHALSRAERNVATGDAAPLEAHPVPARQRPAAETVMTADGTGEPTAAAATVAAASTGTDAPPSRPTEPQHSARPPQRRRTLVGGALLALLVAAGSVLALGVLSGDESEPQEAVLKTTRLRVEPSGRRAEFRAVEGADGKIVLVMSAGEGAGEFTEVARITAPGARITEAQRESGAIGLDADQAGESYSPDGGQGLLSIGERYAEYFGWSLKEERIEFFSSETEPTAEQGTEEGPTFVRTSLDPESGASAEVPQGERSLESFGELRHRTRIDLPSGAVLIIDYTPQDSPNPGGSFSTTGLVVDNENLGVQSSEYATTSCDEGVECVDYPLDLGGYGFGILAAADTRDEASLIARRAAETLDAPEATLNSP